MTGRLAAAPATTEAEAPAEKQTKTKRHPAWRQFSVLAQRYWETIRRDLGYAILLLGQAPGVALMLLTVAESQTLVDPNLTGNAHVFLFVMACAAVWFGMINSVREIVKEIPIYQREHNVGVGIGPYVASKFAVLSFLSVVQIALLVGIVGLRVELPNQGVILPLGGVEIYLSLLAASLVGVALGLLLSAITTSPNRAMTLTPWLLIAQIVYAGVVFKLTGASNLVSWATATRWSVESLAATAHLKIDPHGEILPASTQDPDYVVRRWLILLLLIVISVVVIGVSLRMRDREGPIVARLFRALLPWG